MSDPAPKKLGRPKKVPPLPASLPPQPPRKGHCKPKPNGPPQSQEQESLALAIKEAEIRRSSAAESYAKTKTVASELALLQGDLEVASAWSAYLRSTDSHTHSLKWADMASKFASRVSDLRELVATDLLAELAGRARREQDLARRVGGR